MSFPYRSETGGGLEQVMSKPDVSIFGSSGSTFMKVLRAILRQKEMDSFVQNTAA